MENFENEPVLIMQPRGRAGLHPHLRELRGWGRGGCERQGGVQWHGTSRVRRGVSGTVPVIYYHIIRIYYHIIRTVVRYVATVREEDTYGREIRGHRTGGRYVREEDTYGRRKMRTGGRSLVRAFEAT